MRAASPSPRTSTNPLSAPLVAAGSVGSEGNLPSSPAAIVSQVLPSLDPALVDAAAPSDADVGAQGVCEAGTSLEPQAGAGSLLSSPAPCPSSPGVGATHDTPAIPERLGDELVFLDEFEFEKRQHELEVETWSRQRKEQEDALYCRRAQGQVMLKQ